MILYSWNVNGYRAVLRKGFRDWLDGCGGDVVLLQETKAEPEQLTPAQREPDAFSHHYWNWSRTKKGYAGVACFANPEPLAVRRGLPDPRFQNEGRVLHLEYPDFHLLNVYFPNGQMSAERLEFKLGFYDAFLLHAQDLRQSKPVVVGGDFNTAHREIDLKNPAANADRSGFLPVERAWLDAFVGHGYIDTFRLFETGPHHYSWWSYRFNARHNNAGWRIDYFFVSEELRDRVRGAWIQPEIPGSDHCPIGLELDTRGHGTPRP